MCTSPAEAFEAEDPGESDISFVVFQAGD